MKELLLGAHVTMSRHPDRGHTARDWMASFLAIGSRELENEEWLMYSGERLALAGLLAELRPDRSLEVGCWRGGSTRVLSRYSRSVVSVEVDDTVDAIAAQFPNVRAVCAESRIALRAMRERNERFDFALIDADHSRDGVRDDLTQCLHLADVILLHDTANPDCRAGISDALAGASCYYDLDLLAGGLQPEGLWGGFGIVFTQLSGATPRYLPPRVEPFDLYRWAERWRRLPQRVRKTLLQCLQPLLGL